MNPQSPLRPTLSRPLDRAESFFWFLDQCSSMNFAVVAEGRGPLENARLEAALARAQEIHPALAVAIEAGADGPLAFVPRPGARIAFDRDDGGGAWAGRLVARMVEPFDLTTAPLVRAHRFELGEGRWAFALVFQHMIADGRSGFRLVTDIVEEARGGRAQGGPDGIRPSLMALFPPAMSGPEGEAKAREWKEVLRRTGVKPPEIPGFARRPGPVRPGVVVVRLDDRATQNLVARARKEGASVHGAIGAAELIAMRSRFGDGVVPTLTLTSPVDLRSELSAPMDDATPGFYVTLLSSSHPVSGPGEFWSLARFLTTDLRHQLAEGCGHLFYHLLPPTESMAPSAEVIAGFRAYLQRMPQACMLSNVGRVAALPDVNGVHIENMSFALCPMAHQPLFVAASTWGASLTLNIVHDAERFPAETCHATAEAMRGILTD